jgi:hypothetical protein
LKHLKKYQRLIATFVVILLLLQFGIYPCLTMANTFANIVGAIGLLVICVWVVVAFGGDGLIDKDELKEAQQLLKEKELGETELDYVPKPKTKATRKPKTPKAK